VQRIISLNAFDEVFENLQGHFQAAALLFLDQLVEIALRAVLQFIGKCMLDFTIARTVRYQPADPSRVLSAMNTVIHSHTGHEALPEIFFALPVVQAATFLVFPAVSLLHGEFSSAI